MRDRDLVRLALSDAIEWQLGYAEAVRNCDDGSYEEALKMVKQYRGVLKRRYGSRKTAIELHIERALEGAVLVPAMDIGKK